MSQLTNEYLKTKVLTASPEMLTLMLWDGAIRFAEQGRQAIQAKDIEGSYHALLRSQKIIMELSSTLRHDVNPELSKNLASLYTFVYRRLVDANLRKDAALVEDALQIMRHQRETWVLLMDKLARERVAATQTTAQENAQAAAVAPEMPTVPVAPAAGGTKPAGPGRRPYPAFAVRPAAATLSVEG